MAQKLDRPAAVTFKGQVPHDEVQSHFGQADVFTFPSIREFGGAVVLEAMAMGCVPVVGDYGGPAELITPQCAFALEVGPRASIVNELKTQLSTIVDHPELLGPRSAEGIRRVHKDFSWPAKAAQVYQIYQSVLAEPRFATPV